MPDDSRHIAVIDQKGERGRIIARGETEQGEDYVLVERRSGGRTLVPIGALNRSSDGEGILVDSEFDAFRLAGDTSNAEQVFSTTIPVVEEELVVSSRQVERGRVRVHTEVDERTESVDVPLQRQRVEVERTAVNRPVEEALEPWYEDDTLVIPVIEERAVVRKELVVTEEVRIRRIVEQEQHQEEVTLRSERAEVDRIAPD